MTASSPAVRSGPARLTACSTSMSLSSPQTKCSSPPSRRAAPTTATQWMRRSAIVPATRSALSSGRQVTTPGCITEPTVVRSSDVALTSGRAVPGRLTRRSAGSRPASTAITSRLERIPAGQPAPGSETRMCASSRRAIKAIACSSGALDTTVASGSRASSAAVTPAPSRSAARTTSRSVTTQALSRSWASRTTAWTSFAAIVAATVARPDSGAQVMTPRCMASATVAVSSGDVVGVRSADMSGP